jgi:hypothetical protein
MRDWDKSAIASDAKISHRRVRRQGFEFRQPGHFVGDSELALRNPGRIYCKEQSLILSENSNFKKLPP